MTIVVEALRKARVLSSLGQLRRLAGYNMQPALLRLPQQIPSRQLRSNAETTEQDNDDILNIDPVLGRWKPPISPEDDVAQDEDMDDEEIYHPSAMLAKKLLLDKGYVAYHHNPGLPPWVKAHMTTISKNRTTPQLRRCLQKWMVARHSYDTLKKFSHRPLGWYDNVPSSEDKFANAIVFGPEETAAYTHFFLPSRFAITKRVMNEVKKLLPSFSPVNVLDFGCGPATAAAAISTVWPDTMKHYAGLDRSQSMLDAAAIMTKGLCDTVFWSRTVDAVRQGKRYDMVVMTYTLADLPHDPAKKAATQLAFEFLNEGGILVCIEEGNPIGSHIVRTARQFLLDTFNNVERSGSYKHIAPVEPETPDRVAKPAESTKLTTGHMMLPSPSSRPYNELGATVIAPCTHDRPCPLASGVWCSFSQKVTGPIIRKDSEEKFSYVAMRKIVKNEVGANLSEQWLQSVPASPPATPRANPKAMSPRELLLWFSQQDNRGHLQELMASLEDIEWDDYEPIIRRSEWGRIVR